jgi:formylglycine-generating enzyme required for sulfatase activity
MMKKYSSAITHSIITLFTIIILLILSGCFNRNGQLKYSAGTRTVFTADAVSFTMIYVPGKKFFTGTNDGETATVKKAFWIGETEVTYELWKTVCTWAATSGGYSFANPGIIGSSGTGTIQQPVTTLNWRDAVVWCNAVTEWLNTHSDFHYTCVYKAVGKPIRDARGNNGVQCDSVIPNESATGFRLPTKDEWELAARYRADSNSDGDIMDENEYYPGNYASGASTPYNDTGATARVAVYHMGTTAVVKSKTANEIGVFDMSGNVDEWCFDWYPGHKGYARLTRGGSWITSADTMQIGLITRHDQHCEYFLVGFRLSRTP